MSGGPISTVNSLKNTFVHVNCCTQVPVRFIEHKNIKCLIEHENIKCKTCKNTNVYYESKTKSKQSTRKNTIIIVILNSKATMCVKTIILNVAFNFIEIKVHNEKIVKFLSLKSFILNTKITKIIRNVCC